MMPTRPRPSLRTILDTLLYWRFCLIQAHSNWETCLYHEKGRKSFINPYTRIEKLTVQVGRAWSRAWLNDRPRNSKRVLFCESRLPHSYCQTWQLPPYRLVYRGSFNLTKSATFYFWNFKFLYAIGTMEENRNIRAMYSERGKLNLVYQKLLV